MYAPKNSISSPEVRYDLLNNPITYEILLMIAVVSFAMLMLCIVDRVRPWIAPDDIYDEEEEGYDEDAQPWNLTLTEDGDLLDNESGGRPRHYGTFYTDNRTWYNADGYVFHLCIFVLFLSSQQINTNLIAEWK